MTEPSGTPTTGSLAERLGGRLCGPASLPIRGVNSMDAAGPEEITFITTGAFASRWPSCDAAAAVVSEDVSLPEFDETSRALIVVPDAERAIITLLEWFAGEPVKPEPGIDATAVVHPTVTIGADTRIGPNATIARGVVIGERVIVHAGVHLYQDVRIGDDTVLHAGCVVRERCTLGRRVVLHANAVVGSEGFGYRPDAEGRQQQVPHLGIAELHDRVELGAAACVDRGKFGPTVVGEGTKIDNLVQIGHNCRIGRECVIAAGAGLGGSVTVGDGVRIGGQVGVADHLTIGDGASIAAQSGLMRDVEPGQTVFGSPAVEIRSALRQVSALRKLPDLVRRFSRSDDPCTRP